MKLTALIILVCGCGCRYERDMVSIGPLIGSIKPAMGIIEREVGCEVFEECQADCDVLVKYEERRCGIAGASDGRVSINNPSICPMPEIYDVGLSVHELLHVMGHWHHDEEVDSVMNATVRANWRIFKDDIEWLYDTRCQ